jgi:hypothetical protein
MSQGNLEAGAVEAWVGDAEGKGKVSVRDTWNWSCEGSAVHLWLITADGQKFVAELSTEGALEVARLIRVAAGDESSCQPTDYCGYCWPEPRP